MKRGLLFVAAFAVLLMSVGCRHNLRQNGCQHCQHSHGDGHRAARAADRVPQVPHGYNRDLYQSQGAPPSPQVAYPYYTTRAPRDFLLDQPPSIGH